MCSLPLRIHTPSVSGGFTLMLPEVPCVNMLIFLNLWIYVFHQVLNCLTVGDWESPAATIPSAGSVCVSSAVLFYFLKCVLYLCMNDSSRHVCFKVFARMVASFFQREFSFSSNRNSRHFKFKLKSEVSGFLDYLCDVTQDRNSFKELVYLQFMLSEVAAIWKYQL